MRIDRTRSRITDNRYRREWIGWLLIVVVGAGLVLMVTSRAATGAVSGPSTIRIPMLAVQNPPDVTRISLTNAGGQATGHSGAPDISADARYVVFFSEPVMNTDIQIFRYDRVTDQIDIASVDNAGIPGSRDSSGRAISGDGQVVAISSFSRLAPYGSDLQTYVRDFGSATTELISVAADGRWPNGDSSYGVDISADGRFVAFGSTASNLTQGGSLENAGTVYQIYVRDRQTDVTTLVSRRSDGTPGNDSSSNAVISGDGQVVAFLSKADNLVPNDNNQTWDAFVYDRAADTITRLPAAPSGITAAAYQDEIAISADGRFVAFTSSAAISPSAAIIVVHDRATGQTEIVSRASDGTLGDRSANYASLSADGRYVMFHSAATNLVPGDTNGVEDVFVRDRLLGVTTRVSLSALGLEANGPSRYGQIAPDGSVMAFDSAATNLVAGDTNGMRDVFLIERSPLEWPPRP